MGYQGKYQSVPVEDIRASSITYEQLMMRCFDRLDAMIGTAAHEELYSLVEAKIRYVDSLLYPYWEEDDEYRKKRSRAIIKVKNSGVDSFERFVFLMIWLRLITTRFSKMNILPERNINVVAGLGELKDGFALKRS